MEGIIVNLIVSLLTILPFVEATTLCGNNMCYGIRAYCCGHHDHECCWESLIYDYWWFWCIWIVIFLLILACSTAYWRRRRRNRRAVAMRNSQYPTYGTVIRTNASGNTHLVTPVMYPPPSQVPPNYAQAPPSYAAAALPSYSDSMSTKNNPPAYSA